MLLLFSLLTAIEASYIDRIKLDQVCWEPCPNVTDYMPSKILYHGAISLYDYRKSRKGSFGCPQTPLLRIDNKLFDFGAHFNLSENGRGVYLLETSEPYLHLCTDSPSPLKVLCNTREGYYEIFDSNPPVHPYIYEECKTPSMRYDYYRKSYLQCSKRRYYIGIGEYVTLKCDDTVQYYICGDPGIYRHAFTLSERQGNDSMSACNDVDYVLRQLNERADSTTEEVEGSGDGDDTRVDDEDFVTTTPTTTTTTTPTTPTTTPTTTTTITTTTRRDTKSTGWWSTTTTTTIPNATVKSTNSVGKKITGTLRVVIACVILTIVVR